MSQRELARWSGVPKSTIADVESGRVNVSLDTARRLVQTTGLSLVVLDGSGAVVGPATTDRRRDRGGRHFPAHLDLRERPQRERDLRQGLHYGPNQAVPTAVTFRLDRDSRDVLRAHGFFGEYMWPRVPRRHTADQLRPYLAPSGLSPLPLDRFHWELAAGVVGLWPP